MNIKKTHLVTGLLAIMVILAPASVLWAGGGGPEPPANAIIQGPELWGVVVVYCTAPPNPDIAILRVKRVENCNVETQTLVDQDWDFGCPDPSDPNAAKAPLDWSLPNVTFFDITGQGEPFISRVKNFEIIELGPENTITSFDAQFKYWVPGP
jgi:hypothetical protein